MRLTLELLREKGACKDGLGWFAAKFPDGCEYQEALDALAAENRVQWARWCLANIGRTEDEIHVEKIESEASVFFSGRMRVRRGVKVKAWLLCGEGIEAGWGIEAGEGIEAGWGIEAGEGIKAGGGIEAGWGIKAGWGIEAGTSIKTGADWGIFAGLKVKLSLRSKYARVVARQKPRNLISGEFVAVGGAKENVNA